MSKIKPVTDFENAKKSWDKIFVSTDPFTWPFQDTIEDYLLFYPADGFELTKKQYKATLKAAEKIGDNKFYFSVVEAEEDIFKEKEILNTNIHWLCENPDYKEYLSIVTIPLECGLFSWGGNWGMLISHEDHAVVGGSKVFIDELRKEYPDWRKDREELFNYWKLNPHGDDGSWIKIFEQPYWIK